jgi:hypothetical protein
MIDNLYWYPITGNLVFIRPSVFYEGETAYIGIIIKCTEPAFGTGYVEYFDVLVNGDIINLSSTMLWPIDKGIQYEITA